MAAEQSWIPFRWPSLDGPWRRASALDLLKDTPVNCLVFNGSQEVPPEIREEARRRSWPILVLGGTGEGSLRVVSLTAISNSVADPVLALSRTLWPEIRLGQDGEGSASAGPTGEPWVDSNIWRIRLAQAKAPGKQIWVTCEPPKRRVLRPEAYQVAVADAASAGGRWVVTLDDDLAKRLADGDASARATWRGLNDALKFFAGKADWAAYQPAARLAVISEFAGEHGTAWADALNLLRRRHLPYSIVITSAATKAHPRGTSTMLLLDDQPAPETLRPQLLDLLQKGGTVIALNRWPGMPAGESVPSPAPEFECMRIGQGTLAVSRELITDPYVIAADTHLLMSRRQDSYRVWNAIGMGSDYRISPDGQRAVMQIINYTGKASGNPVTFQTLKPYRTARLITLAGGDPKPLPIHAAERGIEVPLPPFAVYSQVELTA